MQLSERRKAIIKYTWRTPTIPTGRVPSHGHRHLPKDSATRWSWATKFLPGHVHSCSTSGTAQVTGLNMFLAYWALMLFPWPVDTGTSCGELSLRDCKTVLPSRADSPLAERMMSVRVDLAARKEFGKWKEGLLDALLFMGWKSLPCNSFFWLSRKQGVWQLLALKGNTSAQQQPPESLGERQEASRLSCGCLSSLSNDSMTANCTQNCPSFLVRGTATEREIQGKAVVK